MPRAMIRHLELPLRFLSFAAAMAVLITSSTVVAAQQPCSVSTARMLAPGPQQTQDVTSSHPGTAQLTRPPSAQSVSPAQTAQPDSSLGHAPQAAAQRPQPLQLAPYIFSLLKVAPSPPVPRHPAIVTFGLCNNSNIAVTGRITGDVDGSPLRDLAVQGGQRNTISLKAQEFVKGSFSLNNLSLGTHRVTLRLDEGPTITVATPANPNPPPLWQTVAATPFDLIFPEPPILTSSDAPPPDLPKPDYRFCGGSGGTTFPSPGVPYEWAEPLRDAVIPVLGTVVDHKTANNDFPFSHPFEINTNAPVIKGSLVDMEWDIAPDERWRTLLNASDNPSSAGCSDPASVADGDICTAVHTNAEKIGIDVPAGVLHVELEQGLIPAGLYQPAPADRVLMYGHWIVDCGHLDFHTELHPPELIIKAHLLDSGDLESTAFGVPYRTRQLYDGNPWFSSVLGLLVDRLTKAQVIPPPFNLVSLEQIKVIPKIDSVPFSGLVTAHYHLSVPRQADARRTPTMSYSFTTRPGVSVQIRQANAFEADIMITLDSKSYVPAPPPQCRASNLSLDRANDMNGMPPGKLRGVLLNASAAGLPHMDPALLQAVLQRDLGIATCSVPAPGTNQQMNKTIVNKNQPYPIYGWIRFAFNKP